MPRARCARAEQRFSCAAEAGLPRAHGPEARERLCSSSSVLHLRFRRSISVLSRGFLYAGRPGHKRAMSPWTPRAYAVNDFCLWGTRLGVARLREPMVWCSCENCGCQRLIESPQRQSTTDVVPLLFFTHGGGEKAFRRHAPSVVTGRIQSRCLDVGKTSPRGLLVSIRCFSVHSE